MKKEVSGLVLAISIHGGLFLGAGSLWPTTCAKCEQDYRFPERTQAAPPS